MTGHQEHNFEAVTLQPVKARLLILKKRTDFLRTARGRRQGTKGFTLQGRERDAVPNNGDGPDTAIRFGVTCSKKVGNAVARNRAKRRLRALAQENLGALGRPGWDYVLVGRREVTGARDYQKLITDLQFAAARLHGTNG